MPSHLIAALVLLAACAACAPSDAGNGTPNEAVAGTVGPSPRRGPGDPAATIAIVPGQGTDCTAQWDGEAVTPERLRERGMAVLQEGIERIGGVRRLTEENIPFVRLEAPAEAPWSCVAPTLESIRRTGFAHVALAPAGGAAPDQRVHFLIEIPQSAESRPSVVVEMAREGGLTWNGAAIDLDGFGARVRARGGDVAPPGDFVVIPSGATRFAELHALLQVAGRARAEVALGGCRGLGGGRPVQASLTCLPPRP